MVFFGVFLFYNFIIARSNPHELQVDTHRYPVWKSLIFIIIGLAGLIIGGRMIVDNAVELATILGVRQRIIALAVVSIGTSLPELATQLL